MPTQILMPQLSPTMEEGKLATWHVKEGDRVRSGDVVAEIETDKATMEVEAAEDGVIEKLLLAEGTEHVPVNHPHRAADERRRGRRHPDAACGRASRLRQRALALRHSAAHSERGAHRARARRRTSATEQVMHKIAEQIRRNGGERSRGARIFASPLARRLGARVRASSLRRSTARARMAASSGETSRRAAQA